MHIIFPVEQVCSVGSDTCFDALASFAKINPFPKISSLLATVVATPEVVAHRYFDFPNKRNAPFLVVDFEIIRTSDTKIDLLF
jgi:hypothetical protein